MRSEEFTAASQIQVEQSIREGKSKQLSFLSARVLHFIKGVPARRFVTIFEASYIFYQFIKTQHTLKKREVLLTGESVVQGNRILAAHMLF